ncbi:hypothetical protein KKG24_00855 [Patescibacteria group bacterium]|nr:hypothetical protein [Patescibacteria group bacterium]
MSMEDSKILKRGEKGILSQVFMDESVLAAEARAGSLIERAKLNEAIRVVEELEAEVANMTIPARFSRTKKPSQSQYNLKGNATTPSFSDLTEAEYKRKTLLIALESIKENIDKAISGIKIVTLDIEATKQE